MICSIKRQLGLSVLEVLIACSIVTIVCVGLLATQLRAVGRARMASERVVAMTLSANLAEQLRVMGSSCIESGLISNWQAVIKHHLPQGDGQCTCEGGACHIEVRWMNRGMHRVQLMVRS